MRYLLHFFLSFLVFFHLSSLVMMWHWSKRSKVAHPKCLIICLSQLNNFLYFFPFSHRCSSKFPSTRYNIFFYWTVFVINLCVVLSLWFSNTYICFCRNSDPLEHNKMWNQMVWHLFSWWFGVLWFALNVNKSILPF